MSVSLTALAEALHKANGEPVKSNFLRNWFSRKRSS